MKIVKWLGIGIAGLVALIAVVIGIIAATFDPNKYKGDITKLVKEKKQRTLAIPGDLKLAFFPKIGVEVGEVTLSEFNSEATFVKLGGAKIFVELLPLLSKQVVVDRVQIDGLTASVIKAKGGKFNFDDLLAKDESKSAAVKFDIDSVKLSNAAISYADLAQGTQMSITQLNALTGRIADKVPTTVDISAKIEGVKPKANLNLAIKGGMTMDLAAKKFDFSKLATTLTGNLQDGAANLSGLDIKLEAGDLKVDANSLLIAATKFDLAAKGNNGKNPFDVKLSSPLLNVNAKTQAVVAEKISADIKGAQGADSGIIKLEATRFELDNTAHRLAVEGLTSSGSGAVAGVLLSAFSAKAPKLKIDLAGGQIEIDRVALTAAGKRDGDQFDLVVNAPKLNVSKSASSGEAITGTVKLSGKQNVDAKFNLSGVSGNAKALSVGNIKLDYNAKAADTAAVGTLSTALTANLEAKLFELKQIDINVKIDNPNIPAKTVTLPIRGSARADLGKNTVTADITTKFDESAIQAKIGLTRFAPPAYTFDVNIDKLNADRYRTAAPAAGAPGGAEKPIDLAGLRNLNANGTVRIGAFQINNIKASNVVLTVKAAGGKVDVAPLNAALYGGTMSATASINATNNSFAVRNTLTNVQVGPLLRDAASKDLLEGRGNIVANVTTNGTLPSSLKKALAGNVSVKLNDGAIKGINIAERIRDAKALFSAKRGAEGAKQGEKTDFSEMSLTAVLANGVATSNDLNMASPLLRAKGAGKVDIGGNTLDYTIRPKLVATSKGQEGKTYEQLSGIEMPVKLYGSLDAPQYQPDYAAAAMSAAQSEIGGKLLEKAGGGKAAGLLGAITGKPAAPATTTPAAPGAPAPAQEKPKTKDLLKGLFK